MTNKVKRRVPKAGSKWYGAALTQMRKVAFGKETELETMETLTHALNTIDQPKLIRDAAAKRMRRNMKRAAIGKALREATELSETHYKPTGKEGES